LEIVQYFCCDPCLEVGTILVGEMEQNIQNCV